MKYWGLGMSIQVEVSRVLHHSGKSLSCRSTSLPDGDMEEMNQNTTLHDWPVPSHFTSLWQYLPVSTVTLSWIIVAPLWPQLFSWALVSYSMNQHGVCKSEKYAKAILLCWGRMCMSCRGLQQSSEGPFLKISPSHLNPVRDTSPI